MARYDHPLLAHGNFEFALAYKIRRLVLRKMDGRALSYCQRAKAEHQLLVMKDLVLGMNLPNSLTDLWLTSTQRRTTIATVVLLSPPNLRILQPYHLQTCLRGSLILWAALFLATKYGNMVSHILSSILCR